MPRPTPMPSCDPWLALRASTRRTISTALGAGSSGYVRRDACRRASTGSNHGAFTAAKGQLHILHKETIPAASGPQGPPAPSGDFAGGFAPADPVMAQQVLDPPRRGQDRKSVV